MSYIYSVDGTLNLSYSERNAFLVLNQGLSSGFSYHTFVGIGTNTKIISPKEVANKLIIENQKGVGESSFMLTDHQESINIRIYKTKSNQIEVSWSGLDPRRKKDFSEGHHGMDFAYYIEKFVDLYSEFNIISLEASYF